MVELIPAPDPYSLLPPFLACLPTAFVSHRPPPALLALLSPILRQRIQLLTSTSETDSWLKLLCWDKEKAEELEKIVEQGTWDPHPVSGEIEVSGVDNVVYKRLDEETLRARMSLSERNLIVLYLWCVGDQGENGWRVTELVPYRIDQERDSTWSTSISEANSSFSNRTLSDALRDAETSGNAHRRQTVDNDGSDGDDDDYWAQYDQTPGRTPAIKSSPLPRAQPQQTGSADDDYYARYSSVQPALDPTDPSEEPSSHEQLDGQSTLNGNAFAHLLRRQNGSQSPSPHQYDDDAVIVSQPHPSRPSSSAAESEAVAKLEQTAELQSNSEIGVRQHISTSVKSMYRLATSMGMDREEFARIVRRELDVLELLD